MNAGFCLSIFCAVANIIPRITRVRGAGAPRGDIAINLH